MAPANTSSGRRPDAGHRRASPTRARARSLAAPSGPPGFPGRRLRGQEERLAAELPAEPAAALREANHGKAFDLHQLVNGVSRRTGAPPRVAIEQLTAALAETVLADLRPDLPPRSSGCSIRAGPRSRCPRGCTHRRPATRSPRERRAAAARCSAPVRPTRSASRWWRATTPTARRSSRAPAASHRSARAAPSPPAGVEARRRAALHLEGEQHHHRVGRWSGPRGAPRGRLPAAAGRRAAGRSGSGDRPAGERRALVRSRGRSARPG